MADYYVCKYAHKYASEVYYALCQCRDAINRKSINVLSIGCGPCTDLFALDLLERNGVTHFLHVGYQGIDIGAKIWKRVVSSISEQLPPKYSYRIIEEDICKYMDVLQQNKWKPDIIIVQYVFSDMSKNLEGAQIRCFVKALGRYVDSCASGLYVICNDINLNILNGGGREYFDMLKNSITEPVESRTWHFNNSNKRSHFEYGEEYAQNALIAPLPPILHPYSPYTSCASAQMIIKRV